MKTINTAPTRYFRLSNEEETSDHLSEQHDTIEGREVKKRYWTSNRTGEIKEQQQQQEAEQFKQENDKRRTLLIQVKCLEIQPLKNQVEEDSKALQEEKR